MTIPYLSIITVTYNAEATLERTLHSVEAQTAADLIEHIIVDGASKDRTTNIIGQYKSKIEAYPIRVVSEPDNGLYDAMNKGLCMARGDFVCFLNAGDRLHSADTIQSVFAALPDKDHVGVIYGNTDIVDNNGTFLHPRRLQPPAELDWRSFRHGMLVCHQSFYARRELCPPYNTQYRFSADVDWCIRILRECEQRGFSVEPVKAVLTDYLEEGMTTQHHRASLIERFHIMRKHYGLLSTLWHHLLFCFR